MVFAFSDVGIETIAVLGFDAMKLLYLLDDRYQKGMEEGMEKGRAEGMEEGMSQRSLEIARKMCWQRVWQELQGVHPDASLLHPLLPRWALTLFRLIYCMYLPYTEIGQQVADQLERDANLPQLGIKNSSQPIDGGMLPP